MLLAQTPAGQEQWLQELAEHGLAAEYQPSLAALLRNLATLGDCTLLMSSGPACLPYVPWLRDGMSMNNRLIVHQNSDQQNLQPLLLRQQQQDIRVAHHFQNAEEFIADIAHHRFQLLLLDVSTLVLESLSLWEGLLQDQGMIVLLSPRVIAGDRMALLQQHYLLAPLNETETALMLCRKGLQHTRKRRGRRRSA